jgi:chemotaxis signal transduction protein
MTQLFLFSAGSLRFALPLPAVHSVIRMVEIAPVSAPGFGQAGTINLHGRTVPAYSLRALSGCPDRPPCITEMLIIAHAEDALVAFRVDGTGGVGEIALPALHGNDDSKEPASEHRIAITPEGTVVITNIARFLSDAADGTLRDALRALRRVIETGPHAPAFDDTARDDDRSILAERAARLARPESDATPEETAEILRFQLAYRQYAIEMRFVREVILTGEITPVPGTPDFIAGICAVRGQIISLVDLRALFHIPEKGLTDLNRVIVLTDGRLTFGILADTIRGVGTIPLDRVSPPAAVDIRHGQRYIMGTFTGDLQVIDAAALLSDPAIIIDEA